MSGAQVIALDISKDDTKQPTAGRRDARIAATRQRLIEAAFVAFGRAGYHGTSMSDVARAAGLSQGAAYNHFSGKQALFATTFDAFNPFDALIDALLTLSHARSGASGDCEEQLRKALETFGSSARPSAAGTRDWFDLLLIDALEFDCRHWSDLYQRLRPAFARVSGRLEATGQLNRIGGAAAFRAVMAAVLGDRLVGRLLTAGEGDTVRPEPGSRVLDVFLRGVLAESA